MPERRRVKRKYLLFYTRVFDAGTRGLLGNLVDITPQGAMLLSETTLPTDQTFRLRLELAGEVGDLPHIEFEAKSLWCRQDVDPRFYNIGFQLLNVPPENIAVIEKIVEAYGFRDN